MTATRVTQCGRTRAEGGNWSIDTKRVVQDVDEGTIAVGVDTTLRVDIQGGTLVIRHLRGDVSIEGSTSNVTDVTYPNT